MPASAIIATPGSPTANAYVTLAVADQYHLNRPPAGTTWADATTDQKTAAILWATILMDRLWVWNGFVVNELQSLLWPRQGLYMPNMVTPVDDTLIPVLLQYATAEYARQLLVSDRTEDSDIETLGIKLIKTGSTRLDFKDNVYAKAVPDIVANLIPCEWGYVKNQPGIWERELQRA